MPVHPLEPFTSPYQPGQQQLSLGPAYQMLAVDVDNFILAAVEDDTGKVLPPPAARGVLDVKDLISEKKLAKGDACWDK